jgi:signal peptidase I
VVVFRYPPEPNVDYIKRVIGLPGDTVSYQNKQLTINGEPVPRTPEADYLHPDRMYYSKQYRESLNGISYDTLNDADAPAFVPDVARFPYRDQCRYDSTGFVCKVPAGNYFVMGDNRDNSKDSRVWGFVPDANIVGKAFFIWFHWGELGRIGSFR